MNTIIELKTGSGVLPYIDHPRDKDTVLIFLDEDEFQHAYSNRLSYRIQQREKGFDCKLHSASYLPTMAKVWSYEFHFMDQIEGVKYPDIYELHNQILAEINKWVEQRRLYLREAKGLYHLYTTLAMWRNGNYELTSDDIARINRFHDRCATDKDFDIMFKMLEEENGKK